MTNRTRKNVPELRVENDTCVVLRETRHAHRRAQVGDEGDGDPRDFLRAAPDGRRSRRWRTHARASVDLGFSLVFESGRDECRGFGRSMVCSGEPRIARFVGTVQSPNRVLETYRSYDTASRGQAQAFVRHARAPRERGRLPRRPPQDPRTRRAAAAFRRKSAFSHGERQTRHAGLLARISHSLSHLLSLPHFLSLSLSISLSLSLSLSLSESLLST